MKLLHLFLFIPSLIVFLNGYAQDPGAPAGVFPGGISLEYGIGRYAVRDEYISKEKYSGTLPWMRAGWARRHDRYVYILDFWFRNSSDIRNHNVSAEVFEFSLSQGFLYPLRGFSLFSKSASVFLGPSTDLFVYSNEQNIAVSGFDYARSFAALVSIGIRIELVFPVSGRIHVENSLRFGVLSLGGRSVDEEETGESVVKLLTFLSGTHGSFSPGVRFILSDRLSVKTAYLFGLTGIGKWEPLLSASDNLLFTLTFRI